MTKEELYQLNDITVNSQVFKAPCAYFVGLINLDPDIIIGTDKRFLIRKVVESSDTTQVYLNIVYALDLTHPIYKLYYSVCHLGTELISSYIVSDFINRHDRIDLSLLPNFSESSKNDLINKIRLNNDPVLIDTPLLIGLGVIEATKQTVSRRFHQSKISPNIFVKMTKLFKSNKYFSYNQILNFGFDEIEKDEVVSIYEKKLIFQQIIDSYIDIVANVEEETDQELD